MCRASQGVTVIAGQLSDLYILVHSIPPGSSHSNVSSPAGRTWLTLTKCLLAVCLFDALFRVRPDSMNVLSISWKSLLPRPCLSRCCILCEVSASWLSLM